MQIKPTNHRKDRWQNPRSSMANTDAEVLEEAQHRQHRNVKSKFQGASWRRGDRQSESATCPEMRF